MTDKAIRHGIWGALLGTMALLTLALILPAHPEFIPSILTGVSLGFVGLLGGLLLGAAAIGMYVINRRSR